MTIMPSKTSANNFLETLNQCHSSIKFTMEIENNRTFLGTQLLNKSTHVETKVYVKPTNSGLMLLYKSHVDDRYKRGLLKTVCWIVRFDFLLTGPTSLKNAIVSSCCSPVLNSQIR